MSEFSDHASSPTSFVFENLHDVEELFVVEKTDKNDTKNVVKNDVPSTFKIEKKKKISFQQKSDDSFVSSPESIDVDIDDFSSKDRQIDFSSKDRKIDFSLKDRKTESPEKSLAAEVSTEKISPTLIEDRQKSISIDKSDSSKDRKPPKPKPKHPEIVSVSSSDVSEKIRRKKKSEKYKAM